MTGPIEPPITSDHELLVAYLDGELDPGESLRVERRLSEDDGFRQLLKGLQDAWDLLDELPQPTLDDGFTQTTVEMVAVRARHESTGEQGAWQQRRMMQRLIGGVTVAICVGVGFLIVRSWQGTPDRELLENLPVIERVDQYTQIDNLDFLQALAANGLFDETVDTEQADGDSR